MFSHSSITRIRFVSLPVLFLTAIVCLPEPIQAQAPLQTGVIVLNDGRVFQGSITEVPGGYRIQYPGGSSILPFNQISVTSANMIGAYEAFRNNIRTPNADSHLRLAEWCINNGMFPQAEIEIQSALSLEPMRSDARALLRQVDQILRPEPAATPVTTPAASAPRAAISAASFASPSDRSESGLSRETQLDFMRKVQPLLFNKCGNAGCHGPTVDHSMKLKNARTDSPGLRMASEHNLKVLFGLIDYQRPESSPLLLKPLESTPHHAGLFDGPRGQAQYDLVERWIQQVVQERGAGAGAMVAQTEVAPPAIQKSLLIRPGQTIQQVSAEMAAAPTAPLVEPEKLPGTSTARPIQLQSPVAQARTAAREAPTSETAFLDQFRKDNRPDQFDPEEFNRMMHSPGVVR